MEKSIDQNKITSYKDNFDIASSWFGTHCGSGFATGAQGVAFFVMFGAATPYMTIISAAIMGVFAYFLWEFARIFKTYDYRTYYDELFYPYDKIFATIYELLYLSLMTMGMGSVFAGGGELIADIIGTPLFIGSFIISIIIFALTIFGAEFLRKSASFLSALLVIIITAITVLGMVNSWDTISEIMRNNVAPLGWGTAFKFAVLYASFQCIITGTTVSFSEVIKTRKDSMFAAVFGFLMNGGMMFLLCTMMLGYYPGVNDQVLPVYYIITQEIGSTALQSAYTFVLFLAFVTTGMTLIFSIVKRFERYGEKHIPKIETRRKVYSAVFIVICYLISLAGLLNIIKKGYTAIGYLGVPFVVIPTIVIGAIKVKKELAKRSSESAEAV